MKRLRAVRAVTLLACSLMSVGAFAASAGETFVTDRTVVRFSAPEVGGATSPRFIFQRFLAFEARLEGLADSSWEPRPGEPYLERHIRAAIERHVGEVLLSSLHIDPEPTADELKQQTAAARLMVLENIGGEVPLRSAATAEGIAPREILGLFRRRARASLYLDRMVAPMLRSSERELREIYSTAPSRLRAIPFEDARDALERWYTGRRLAGALEDYFESSRARLRITILPGH